MGNEQSHEYQQIDLVHPLNQKQRLNHLVCGYMRFYYDFEKNKYITYHTPSEVITICLNYTGEITITSETELQIEYENELKIKQLIQSKNENYQSLLELSTNAIKTYSATIQDDISTKLEKQRINVMVLGPGGVGKSCLVIRYVADHFVEDYDPTLEDWYRKQRVIDDRSWTLEVWDTVYNEFACFNYEYYKRGDAFVFVYSITNRQSFKEVKEYIDRAKRIKGDDYDDGIGFFGILVGNKCDLDQYRQVEKQEGIDLAIENKNLLYFETSAKDGVMVNEMFDQSVRLWMHSEITYNDICGINDNIPKDKQCCNLL